MDQAVYKAANRARVALTHGEKTFVVMRDDKLIHHSNERGFKPVLDLMDSDPAKLEGSIVGDRIVGRSAAYLFIFSKVKAVFALSISDEAADLLEKHSILATWQETVPYIVERDLTSRYKLDIYIGDVDDPAKATEMIREYLEKNPRE
jgi:hypothetical protein